MVSVFKLPKSINGESANQGELILENIDGVKIDAFGMGVLSDGTPFLTQRGLANLCGVENAHIGTISSQWSDVIPKPRISKIRDILDENGHQLETTHVKVKSGAKTIFAYREEISLAILEYYAFEAENNCQPEARNNFKVLAKKGFRDAIYEAIGYQSKQDMDQQWQPFHDRLSLVYNSSPDGYFSVFKEAADFTLNLGEKGIYANDSIIPDISIGRCWSHHWKENFLENKFGSRKEYNHNYPEYFPQAISNPQTPYCYPEEALGEFRRWLREDYIKGGKYNNYIRGLVQNKRIDTSKANDALEAYNLTPLKINSSSS